MDCGGKAIGLFGGTFDPVHCGHLSVVRSYLNSGILDELWIILTPYPPHKSEKNLSPYSLRKRMLQQAFKDVEGVVLTDVETELPKPSYTLRTLLYLKKQYKNERFYLCIGEDSLSDFESWYGWSEILKHCDLLVAARPGFQTDHVNEDVMKHAHFIEHEPVNVSSTGLRLKLSRGEDVGHLVPDGVYNLIKEYNLYQN